MCCVCTYVLPDNVVDQRTVRYLNMLVGIVQVFRQSLVP